MVRSDFVHDNNKHCSLVIIINGSYMVIVLGRHCIKMSRQMFRVVQLALERCKAFFDKHYLLANMGVYGSLYSVGDITCQLISHANTTTPHDWERTKRMGTMGCTVLPLLNTYFYRFLDRAFIGGSPRIVFKKLIIDTFVWTPPILAIFIAGLTILEGKSWPEVKEELRMKYFTIYKKGLMIWPLAQAINFAFIHPRYRIAYLSCVGFCWVNFLSYVKHKDIETCGHRRN